MMLRKFLVCWWFIAGFSAFGLLILMAVRGHSAEPNSRDQQLADIERQLQDLARKLEELKQDSPGSTVTVPGTISPEWIKKLSWRSIGPAAMGGRIIAISVFEADPSTYWIATASGGLLKTVNNGVTFEHQFDRESTVAIGDVCVAPSDRNIIWVGTGENNPRNSVSYGDGVYQSTDGGKTWKNRGLTKTFQIGRIVVHPKNPDIVYVGALGRLYGPSEERGLYKTTDGGKTWNRILFVDDKTGVIDMQMHPTNSETLLVATWERQRDGFDSHRGEPPLTDGYDAYDPIKKWGPGSGLYKTTDGGKTFKKLIKGLPTNPLGRMGIDYYRKDPNKIVVLVDCEKIAMGTPPSQTFLGVQGEDGGGGAKLTQITPESPAAKAGLKEGDVIKAIDKKDITGYATLTEQLRTHKPGDKITLTVVRDNKTLEITVTLATRPRTGGPGAGPGQVGGAMLLGAFGEDAEEGGVYVNRIVPDSAAAKAGIKEGDVIKALEKKDVAGFRNLVEQLRERKEGDQITLQIVRENQTRQIQATLTAPAFGGPGGGATRTRPYSFAYGGQVENVQDQQGPNSFEYGGIYQSTDGGESWTRINSLNPRPMYFSHIRLDPSDDKYLYVCGISLHRSHDGGKTFKADGGNRVHPDQHTLWINPRDGRHMIVGCDGGFYVTYDRMEHWDHLNHMAIGQFYHVAVDNKQPYRVYGGLQDNGSWGGPSHGLSGGPINEDWIFVSGGDGFVCRVDPNEPDLVYFESQDGNIGRYNLRSGERGFLRARQQSGTKPYRFNWNTPFILSHHNPHIFYCAGNYVFRSLNRGNDLRVISPEISRTGRGTASAIAESPKNPELIYAGTDDGHLWVTRNGGTQWANITERIPLPGPRWVASIEPSRFMEGRAYVVFDAHRSDDDEPYVFVTEDFGKTWKSLRANLPSGSTRVLREDIKNPSLLFLGTEFGAWVSLNRGDSWTKLNNNLPTVAIHEFAIHPTAGEIVAATHGRSLWVLDVTPLRQMNTELLATKSHLYEPNTVVRWRSEPTRISIYGNGSRRFYGQNQPPGAQIFYSLSQKPEKISLKIVDYTGKTVSELPVKKEPGFHLAPWNLTRSSPRPLDAPAGAGRGRRAQTGMPFGGQGIPNGLYRVVLNVDDQEFSQPLRVEGDPSPSSTIIAPEEEKEDKGKNPRIDD
ncbi:MAG TPA: PDZ domain-containing protein [Gemmataceae bacterium]|jgi:photosystem II stability/assembly factor-like uncharacterized protein|nr:PDZ domain-containing protein [Gemmataceae bacterium]